MNRREALVASIAGVLGGGLVKPATLWCLPKPQLTMPDPGQRGLDVLNEACRFETVRGNWRLWWRGWLMTQDQTFLTGVALAYWNVGTRLGLRHDVFYYASVPGGEDRGRAGDTLRVHASTHEMTLYIEEVSRELHGTVGLEKATRLRDDAFARLLKVMREHGEDV